MYYPLNVGRNMNEILQALVALEALQTSDKFKVAMPLDWKKGDKVIVPPPKTPDEMNARLADDSIELVDFYLAKKNSNTIKNFGWLFIWKRSFQTGRFLFKIQYFLKINYVIFKHPFR